MKKFLFIAFMISVLILAFVNLAGCTKIEKVYVCANGREVMNPADCPTNKVAGLKKKDAEANARKYVSAYFSATGGRSSLVSSYLDPDKGDYFATFIVNERDGVPYETTVQIDGKTGQVACSEKCTYVS
ncbi:hypothetical protein ACFL0V_06855 [Nanoarchaeota archaeon]